MTTAALQTFEEFRKASGLPAGALLRLRSNVEDFLDERGARPRLIAIERFGPCLVASVSYWTAGDIEQLTSFIVEIDGPLH